METPDRERVYRIDAIERRLEKIDKAMEAHWDKIRPRAIDLNEHRKRLAKIGSKRREKKLWISARS